MDAVLFEAASQCPFEQAIDEPNFRLAFGDDGEARKERQRIVRPVPGDLSFVETTDCSRSVDIPKAGFRARGNGRGAMSGQKDLPAAILQLPNQAALAIGLKAALDFVDDGDRRLALVVRRDGERGQAASPRAPRRERQRDPHPFRR
jgi:hypothetical protein